MIRKIVLLGPQGSGKTTQAEKIVKLLNIPHLSAGNVLRELPAFASQINQGNLLPSAQVAELMFVKLRQPEFKNGWILDGFPRDIVQAKILDQEFTVDKVFNIEISDQLAIDRLAGRLVCKNGHVFHLAHKQSSLGNICEICGQSLNQRGDDKPEAIQKRLMLYRQVTAPLIAYYKNQGKLVVFDGRDTIDNIALNIRQYLENNA